MLATGMDTAEQWVRDTRHEGLVGASPECCRQMNYLAHVYLAEDDPESIIGALMGDFAKGRIDPTLAPGIRRGILTHRKVDAFTDAHEVFRASKRRLRPQFRRYGGILVDLYYDHFLAVEWSRYSDVSLMDFSRRVYGVLQEHRMKLPPRMQRSVSYMVNHDLLLSYRDTDGIHRALKGIEGRLKRQSRLRDAIVDLEQNRGLLAADFFAFFPELIAYVRQLQGEHEPVSAGKPSTWV